MCWIVCACRWLVRLLRRPFLQLLLWCLLWRLFFLDSLGVNFVGNGMVWTVSLSLSLLSLFVSLSVTESFCQICTVGFGHGVLVLYSKDATKGMPHTTISQLIPCCQKLHVYV